MADVGNLIITPDMVPPDTAHLQALAAGCTAMAAQREEQYQKLRAANRLREEAAQSPGWQEGHQKNRQMEVDYGRITDAWRAGSTYFNGLAEVCYSIDRTQKYIVAQANDELAKAKTVAEQQAIIAERQGYARALTANAVEEAGWKLKHFERAAGDTIAALTSRLGPSTPQAPAFPQPTGGGGGITEPASRQKDGLSDEEGSGDGDSSATNSGSDTKSVGTNKGQLHDRSDISGQNGDPTMQAAPGAIVASPFPGGGSSPAPTGGGSGIKSAGFAGGIAGSGGPAGSVVGGGTPGGGLSGLSLSGLTPGAGQVPSAEAAGLGGLPAGGTTGAQATPIGTAFTQGVAAGSNAGSAIPPPPATGIGTPATAPSTTVPTPAAGAGATGVPPVASGVQAPVTSASTEAPTSGASPTPVMLPPPGMGAPPASGTTPPPPSVAAQIPGSPTAPAPASSAGGAVPVPVPSAVPAASARQQASESPELALAKAVTVKLRRNSDGAGAAVVEWAAAVFRSEAGATDCVVTSSEGDGYIPWDVFVPRTARILANDPGVDAVFRERWFHAADPALMLQAYAKRRAGARLVAMAATANSPALHEPGVESAVCKREFQRGLYARPVLDETCMHRLEARYPDVWARIQRLNPVAVKTQVIEAQVDKLVDTVRRGTVVGCPDELREMWRALGPTGKPIDPQSWRDYWVKAVSYSMLVDRPGVDGDHTLCRAQWRVARAMEAVWFYSPFDIRWGDGEHDGDHTGNALHDVADMLYAVLDETDFAAEIEPALRRIENDTGQ